LLPENRPAPRESPNADVVVRRRSGWVGEEAVTGEVQVFHCAKFCTSMCGVAPSASPQRERERETERESERESERERERVALYRRRKSAAPATPECRTHLPFNRLTSPRTN
jgi:hypothetical protein